MADIRVQVPDDFMKDLRGMLVGVDSNNDVVKEALTLLYWAAEERSRQRLILSTNIDGEQVERLAMRSLPPVQPRSAGRKEAHHVD